MAIFKEISVESILLNPFTKIGKEWMLITSGNMDNWNTMTASWGALGVIWHRNVSYVFVRYSRYTYEFMERNDVFTLSFFPPEYRDALSYCGAHSGRDVDKASETGLVPIEVTGDTVSFEKDYHKMYIGEIEKVLAAS